MGEELKLDDTTLKLMITIEDKDLAVAALARKLDTLADFHFNAESYVVSKLKLTSATIFASSPGCLFQR